MPGAFGCGSFVLNGGIYWELLIGEKECVSNGEMGGYYRVEQLALAPGFVIAAVWQ